MPDPKEFLALLREEIKTRAEQGCDVAPLQKRLADLAPGAEPPPPAALEPLYTELEKLAPRADFPYGEPIELEAIKTQRPDGPRQMAPRIPKKDRSDRTLGGWLGRCCGCLLGATVEGWTKEKIEKTLQFANAYPLDDYFPPVPENTQGLGYDPRKKPTLRGNINGMVRDDDMDYTILGLHMLEENGRALTSLQVANQWLTHLPYHCVYTAERVAYRNLVNGIWPPDSAKVRNPYREWIGAQIRADAWGYANPGRPEEAARLAYVDASVSHIANGTYGEMLFSAAIAAAFAVKNVEEALAIGLSEIPKNCRLAEAVRDTIQWAKEDMSSRPGPNSWQHTWDKVMAKYGHYHRVHTINNAACVVIGLMHGQMPAGGGSASGGDFGRTISIAVMCGLDTDCNGATAGSLVGVLLGAKALPPKWVEPLNNRLRSIVVGFNENKISDLAKRTMKVQVV